MKGRYFLTLLTGLAFLGFGPGASDSSAQGTGLTGTIVYDCGGDICKLELSTGVETQLTFTTKSESNPKISPDGSKIAFLSGGIFVMNSDGTGQTLLSTFGEVPAWSPDGTKIAFGSSSRTISSQNGIWVMNAADGSGKTQLTTFGHWPAWSPDGSHIAFSSDKDNRSDLDLWEMDVTNFSTAASTAHRVCSRPGADIDVVWSPGAIVAFGGFVDVKSGYEIFVCDPSTSTLTRLTTSPKNDFEPAWSPDRTKIAFASFRTPAGIYVMNANGSSPRLIIPGGRQPSWGP